jgi:hypothetical protein
MQKSKTVVALAFALGILAGIVSAGVLVRPAAADGADEMRRSRVALESIAHSLEKCPR